MRFKNLVFMVLVVMLAFVVLAGCSSRSQPDAESQANQITSSDWWDKFGEPQYGGTITLQAPAMSLSSFDSYNWMGGAASLYLWKDSLFMDDWKLDRKTFDFSTLWVPETYWQGQLAESWEWKNPQTLVINLRKGVHWQNKPPVNGREFTADDVAYNYDRLMGTGSFTEGSPYYAGRFGSLKKVTATDKYTVTFEFASSNQLANWWGMLEPITQLFEAKEAVEQGIDNDWQKANGTGPYIISDYTNNVSITYSKNPNYWGYDERNPKNKLPYADSVKILSIPDSTTAQAAIRAGKIDLVTNIEWQQATSLAKTNPELKQAKNWQPDRNMQIRVDKAPFNDIRVRKALQMSIDLGAIAKGHYGGTVEGTPVGTILPLYKGYNYPYDEWPQSLKDQYSYNPTMAKQLLSDAGYPQGFKTNVVAASNADLNLLQIIKANFLDIGVDLDIRVMDSMAAMDFVQAGKHDALFMGPTGGTASLPPAMSMAMWTSTERGNVTKNNDANYDALVKKIQNASSSDEARKLFFEADKYFIQSHWTISTFPTTRSVFWNPSLKGYSGEYLLWGQSSYISRWWKNEN